MDELWTKVTDAKILRVRRQLNEDMITKGKWKLINRRKHLTKRLRGLEDTKEGRTYLYRQSI